MSASRGHHPIGGRVALVAVAVGCALAVALLGAGVVLGWGPQLRTDGVVSRALYAGDDRSPWVSGALETLTAPGSAALRWAVFAPVVVVLLHARRWAVAAWVGVAVVGVSAVNEGLKQLFGRVRPDFAEGGARYESLSFPSGHSAGIACLVATALVLAWPRLTPPGRRWWTLGGVTLVLLVGCTRMWLGVHYLSDVVAGWAVGVGWTAAVVAASRGVSWRRA